VIRVLRLDRPTAERLRAAPPDAGRVHSAFAGAINLAWHDGRLLALHGPGPLRAPFALALSALPGSRSGAAIRATGVAIDVDGARLAWDGARVADLRMPRGDLEAEMPALGALLESRGEDEAPALSGLGARRARSRAAEGLAARDPDGFLEGARALIGLGEGLTPAGDDCLIGALAAIHRFEPGWLALHGEIGDGLAAAAWDGTTDIAREFVLHAVAGRFSEPVLDVLTAGSDSAIRAAALRLRRMGATSGADTLAGIRLALDALACLFDGSGPREARDALQAESAGARDDPRSEPRSMTISTPHCEVAR